MDLSRISIGEFFQNQSDQLQVSVQLPEGMPSEALEFAYYLLRDQQRVGYVKYGSDLSQCFETQGQAGEYQAKVFVRLATAPDQVVVLHSEPLTLQSSAAPRRYPEKHLFAQHRVAPAADLIDPHHAPNRSWLVQQGHWSLPVVELPKAGSEWLFVLVSSAVERGQVILPHFHRWAWADLFPGHVLCVADPTLALDEQLSIGWYLGTAAHDLTAELASVVGQYAAARGIVAERVVFWGSSAGGFAALALARALPGATAVTINGQADGMAYNMPEAVQRVCTHCFGGLTPEQVNAQYAGRINLVTAWQPDDPSAIVFVQNTEDHHHFEVHFLPLWRRLTGQEPQPGWNRAGRFQALVYTDPRGHVPETKDMLPDILAHVQQPVAGGSRRQSLLNALADLPLRPS